MNLSLWKFCIIVSHTQLERLKYCNSIHGKSAITVTVKVSAVGSNAKCTQKNAPKMCSSEELKNDIAIKKIKRYAGMLKLCLFPLTASK